MHLTLSMRYCLYKALMISEFLFATESKVYIAFAILNGRIIQHLHKVYMHLTLTFSMRYCLYKALMISELISAHREEIGSRYESKALVGIQNMYF